MGSGNSAANANVAPVVPITLASNENLPTPPNPKVIANPVSSAPPLASGITASSGTSVNNVTPTANPSNELQNTSSSHQTNNPVVVLDKQRLQELVAEIDSKEQLDEEVEDMLLNIADDFIDNLGKLILFISINFISYFQFYHNVNLDCGNYLAAVTGACLLARHRGSKTVESKDVQLTLEKNYNMHIPGFRSLPLIDEFKNVYKKSPATEAHKQRMALIKKTVKKF